MGLYELIGLTDLPDTGFACIGFPAPVTPLDSKRPQNAGKSTFIANGTMRRPRKGFNVTERRIGRLSRAWPYLKNFGLKKFVQEARYQATNLAFDRWYGVETHVKIANLSEVGLANPDWLQCIPTSYAAIRSALSGVPIPLREISFLDLGSGAGRPVIFAAALGCRHARGVDVVPEINKLARANVAHMRRRRCPVEIVEGDAAAYPIPRDVNVIYMANAFAGATLRKVVSNIRESYLLAPRPMHITYFVTQYAWDSVVTEFPWIQRRATHTYYPGWPYGLYEVCP